MKKWIPGFYELDDGKNSNRLHSIWLGIMTPLVDLPQIVWRNVLTPLIGGSVASIVGLLFTMWALLMLIFAGFAGRLVTVEQTNDAA